MILKYKHTPEAPCCADHKSCFKKWKKLWFMGTFTILDTGGKVIACSLPKLARLGTVNLCVPFIGHRHFPRLFNKVWYSLWDQRTSVYRVLKNQDSHLPRLY